MSAVPGDLSTEVQPPLSIPIRHFLVGLGFLLAGSVAALALALPALVGVADGAAGFARVAAAHLLLVGWVGLTILGAVTQFVPVWSGVPLHSDRLGSLQLVLVGLGVPGFAASLWVGAPAAGVPFALAMGLGVLVFGYNVGRTLLAARPWDVTETHFALALGFFAAAVTVALTLALDFRYAVFPVGPVGRVNAVAAHATLAVFGGVVVTVAGALYQLGPMFTQSDPEPLDCGLQRIETVALPTGVATLAVGRLLGHGGLAAVGGVLVATGVLAVGWVLARRVRGASVPASPMTRRYAVVAGALLAWGVTAGATWAAAALHPGAVTSTIGGAADVGAGAVAGDATVRFGAPSLGPYLLLAAVGFVVIGTLYHVVPFLIWVHRYSDRVGLEAVPTIEDLYDDRLAALDLAATGGGLLTVGLAVVAPLVTPSVASRALLGDATAADLAFAVGTLAVVAGVALFVANLVRTVVVHAPSATGLPARGSSRRGRSD
ncbi:MAG: hypothetical protein ABEH81_02080 [Halopenitus sp.]